MKYLVTHPVEKFEVALQSALLKRIRFVHPHKYYIAIIVIIQFPIADTLINSNKNVSLNLIMVFCTATCFSSSSATARTLGRWKTSLRNSSSLVPNERLIKKIVVR